MSRKLTSMASKLAENYSNLSPEKVEFKKAYGVVLHNSQVGGVTLADHPAGSRVTIATLERLGYEIKSTTAVVDGDLDSL